MPDRPENPAHRLALRIEEAAELLGLSEGAFRQHLLPDCPKFFAGRSVRIPLSLLRVFIEDLARDED